MVDGNIAAERRQTYRGPLAGINGVQLEEISHGTPLSGEVIEALAECVGDQDAFVEHQRPIEAEVVGRGDFFQMWSPDRFASFREEVRSRLRTQRAQGNAS